jgi:DNA polymerase/3'-5' exonuclease PolX
MKTKRPFSQVMPIAEKIVDRLTPYCDRIEIAGSLRRQKSEIGDIEIIAIPKRQTDLFGVPDISRSELDAYLNSLMSGGKIRYTEKKRWGDKLKSFVVSTTDGNEYQIDLFLQPDPATWGVNMMIRTGCADFSKKMVTQRSKGGWMPDDMYVREARLWRDGEALLTSEESMVFAWMNKAWVEPCDRTCV